MWEVVVDKCCDKEVVGCRGEGLCDCEKSDVEVCFEIVNGFC